MNNEEIYKLANAAPEQKRHVTPFRLESSITLASSDKYNDPYECEVFARRLRDRYVVSVVIMHGSIEGESTVIVGSTKIWLPAGKNTMLSPA